MQKSIFEEKVLNETWCNINLIYNRFMYVSKHLILEALLKSFILKKKKYLEFLLFKFNNLKI